MAVRIGQSLFSGARYPILPEEEVQFQLARSRLYLRSTGEAQVRERLS